MPLVDFIWFERPLEKIAEHGVTKAEVEQVVRAAPAAAIAQSESSQHLVVKGRTRARRSLLVVFDWADDGQTTVIPITAYDKE